MNCHWCGSYRGVKEVRRNGEPMPSPFPGVPLRLCFGCWGLFKETGQRKDQTGQPQPGPITGIPMTPTVLRALGRG
jgi:hypothetical protein